MNVPEPNPPTHDDREWPGVAAIVVLFVVISWIGWATFFSIVLWCVIAAATVAAAICAIVAVNAEKDDEKQDALMLAGGGVVVAIVAWFLIPSSSTSKNGIDRASLKLAAHTVYGSWSEADLFGNQTQQWSGSAGVIKLKSGKLYLISNSHCLGLAELRQSDSWTDGVPDIVSYQLEVVFASGKRKPVLRFADQDGSLDLSMLEVDASGLTEGKDYVILPFSQSLALAEGDEVVAVGSPLGFQGTQTFGRISALREQQTPERHRLIQTDAAINPGNSGGPLFVRTGKDRYYWIGINTWKVIGADNLGFAIDARDAMATKYRWYSANAAGAAKAIRTLYR
ncbi:MAG: hypothetical protein KatS3mg105_3399 [Gemmatales bacterium]|nr:MAG: hypothetical protein KatS3mg105_3399 [Gemmatales bacterium]